jgi:hypothetical protein
VAFARVLTFDSNGRGQKRFEIVYAAILLGAPKGARGLEAIRREARILDALDAISVGDGQAGATGPIPARRVTQGARLVLAQPEYELVGRYLEAVEWTPAASRDVIDAADWVSAAATHEDP